MANLIKCPHCNREFEMTDVLKHQIEEDVKSAIENKLKKEIEEKSKMEFDDLERKLKEKDEKVKILQEQELTLREQKRKVEEKEKELELELTRKIDEARKNIEAEVLQKASDDHRLKDLEKDKKISDLMKSLEDAQRKALQGSQQTQGEVVELELEESLKRLFPYDEIIEVKKGELGGDVRQIVKTPRGTSCGLILWERKMTKNWDEKWIGKLKDDMRRDKAQVGIIFTEIFPKDFKHEMGERNGVWLVGTKLYEPLAFVVRKALYDIAKNQAISANKQSKSEELYDYVTGHEFVQQVERMVETYLEMKNQISKERASSERVYKLREMQVDRLLKGVSGIYGSIQGIAGSALPQVKNLELESGDN